MGSPCSSDSSRRARAAWAGAALVIALASTGCVTVRPEQREVLADPAMVFGSGGDAAAQEEHVLSNREGSIGGGASMGGGCGCN